MRFNTKLIRAGDRYGSGDQLRHQGEPVLEFYDPRWPYTPLGQFISRYYVKTLLNTTGALQLELCTPEWVVSADDLEESKNWVRKL